MKVDNSGIGEVLRSQQRPQTDDAKAAKGRAERPRGKKALELSGVSRQLAAIKARADGIGDIRPDKVERARLRLAAGFYDSPRVKDSLARRLASVLKKLIG